MSADSVPAPTTQGERPPVVKLRWCPACGRTDRWTPFGRKWHWAGQLRCKGEPVAVTYDPVYIDFEVRP